MIAIIISISSLLQKVGVEKMQLAMTNQFLRITADGDWENFITPFSNFMLAATRHSCPGDA